MNHFRSKFGAPKRLERALLTLVVAFASLATFGASVASTHLIIHFTDGTKTGFVLADKPAVSFVDNNVRVRANHVDTDFEVSTVEKFVFGDALASIETVAPNEVRFTIPDADHVTVEGLKRGETVTVVSVEGRVVHAVRANADGSVQIELTQLPKGIYIVATESGKTIKMKH